MDMHAWVVMDMHGTIRETGKHVKQCLYKNL